MNDYQKVIRGRESLKKLPELCQKLGIQKPLIVGMEPLTGTLLKKTSKRASASLISELKYPFAIVIS